MEKSKISEITLGSTKYIMFFHNFLKLWFTDNIKLNYFSKTMPIMKEPLARGEGGLYVYNSITIPLKHNSSSPSSGITNLRWPEDDTAWGRNGWNEKPLTVSAQQTIKNKAYSSYKMKYTQNLQPAADY